MEKKLALFLLALILLQPARLIFAEDTAKPSAAAIAQEIAKADTDDDIDLVQEDKKVLEDDEIVQEVEDDFVLEGDEKEDTL